ncbi:MAG: biopolymer transporter ExbD [Bacteroidaceae bacterium]|jgi:biopolymer transport protein ExbD|nr:biopolymer transporter ExbD [Bacteroidaceae bacterium]MBQ5476566.1 biopolymer transporter ExbD [Bacteroidaceae bacterium]
MAKKGMPELNTSSTADISFMLLIFFLITTSMATDRGLARQLPPPPDPNQKDDPELNKVKERNVLKIRMNSQDYLMCGDEFISVLQLKDKVKEFIKNVDDNPNWPEKHPANIPLIGEVMVTSKHVISVQNDRGSSYRAYFEVQNEVVRAYNELRDELAKAQFHKKSYAECTKEEQKAIREYYPQKISEAEPKSYGGH